MASSSTYVPEKHVSIVCSDGNLRLNPTDPILVDSNLCLGETYSYPSLTIPIMTMQVMEYCRHHNAEFIKLAHPFTLFSLFEAAHAFHHKNLLDLTCQTLVSMVKGKSVEEMRTHFIINQDYDWNSTEKPSIRVKSSCYRRTTVRGKEEFTMPPDFDFVQRSLRVTKALHYIYAGRFKSIFECCVGKLLKPQSDADMLSVTMSISSIITDQVLARHLEDDHVETAYAAARNREGGSPDEMAPLAVLTLTNIVKALPKFVVDILKTGVLECVKRVLLKPRTAEIVKHIAMFLVAVCRTIDLYCFDEELKVDLALATLQVLELSVSLKHDKEQACNAFQYLTCEMELQIGDLAFRKLIEKLIAIIQNPPPGNCQFPGYALGVLGNIAIWGSSDQIKILALDSTFLESLVMAMKAGSKKIQKEACLIISNIAAQKEGLIEEMHSARLTGAVCGLLEKNESDEDADVKREAVWAIYSCIYGSVFDNHILMKSADLFS
ncbi:hypothetical protein POM88_054263 [Heracleum sosnowskyi]|uniref:SKP1 component dimerisation domain-containing protein n=1 Tax=Heracleum sosnowskyi TaxID=360622 RepID=A0AAD8GN49_9APIA|nr:hypothetical protein POM88_054263 [Heracleum sosnowskyi]